MDRMWTFVHTFLCLASVKRSVYFQYRGKIEKNQAVTPPGGGKRLTPPCYFLYTKEIAAMRTTIVFRYLFQELVTPFFLGLTVFVFILVMSQILRLNELIIVYGVGLWTVMNLVFFLMISFLAISIPIAFLFSVIMLFGRLSSDSELTAMKASGFSVVQQIGRAHV